MSSKHFSRFFHFFSKSYWLQSTGTVGELLLRQKWIWVKGPVVKSKVISPMDRASARDPFERWLLVLWFWYRLVNMDRTCFPENFVKLQSMCVAVYTSEANTKRIFQNVHWE